MQTEKNWEIILLTCFYCYLLVLEVFLFDFWYIVSVFWKNISILLLWIFVDVKHVKFRYVYLGQIVSTIRRKLFQKLVLAFNAKKWHVYLQIYSIRLLVEDLLLNLLMIFLLIITAIKKRFNFGFLKESFKCKIFLEGELDLPFIIFFFE